MNLTRRHRWTCVLLAALLTAASLGAPARAGAADDEPEGVSKLIKYTGCALGIGLAKTPQTLTMAVYLCLQMMYDEATR